MAFYRPSNDVRNHATVCVVEYDMSPMVVRALAAVTLAAIAVVLVGAFRSDGGSDPAQAVTVAEPTNAPAATTAPEPVPILGEAQELVRLDGWLNSDDTTLQAITEANKVTVVQFWTFGCFNCKNRISHTQELYAEYKSEGLEIIGVHAPEFERERDPEAVLLATQDLGVVWPVALDTEKTNFRAWQENRRFWPRVYVLDQNGKVRYDHIGEGDYDGLEETVAYLIENGP